MRNSEVNRNTVDPMEALDVEGSMAGDMVRALARRALAERTTGKAMSVAEASAWYVTDRASRLTE